MTDLFLIAHKVRGEPAFDVATQIECAVCRGGSIVHSISDYTHGTDTVIVCSECDGTGYWWIVPTSGHRAYPWWHMPLLEHCLCLLADGNYAWAKNERGTVNGLLDLMPNSIPDHYTSRASTPVPSGLAALLAKRKPLNVERRGR